MGKKSILPSGYKQLEYISSEGNAYMDTGWVYKVAPRIVTECKHLYSNNPFDVDFFGCQSNTAPSWIGNFGLGQCWYRYGPTTAITGISFFPDGYDTWVPWDIGKEIYIAGTLVKTCSDYDFSTNTQTCYLFKGRSLAKCAYKIVKLYDGDTQVRNLVPCKNPSDVVGMYDTIGGTFYGSQRQPFLAGPEV